MASNKNYMLNDKFPKHIKNATSTSDGLMSSEDKAKFDELFEFGLLSLVTQEKDGIMMHQDKKKLDEIEEGANNYVHPDTHSATIIVEDSSHRFVTDVEKTTWNSKASKAVVTDTVNGLMSAEDKVKLNNIEENANNYVHPSTHAATIIVEDSTHRFVTDEDKAKWNASASIGNSTSTTTGLMSADDKAKLDGIEENANKYVHPSTHPASIIVQDANNRFVTDTEKATWNAKASTNVATQTDNGLMSASDKAKLDGIEAKANNYIHPDTHPATMITEDSTHRFVTDEEKTAWTNGASIGEATGTTTGLLSAEDKAKLDTVEENANYYVHPTTHSPSIIAQDANNRFVTDTEKATWNAKAANILVSQTANGLMSSSDKTKLDGIESGANKYVHPSTHPASIIVQDANNRFVTDTEKATWNAKASTAVATTTTAGLMSAEDKVRLDNLSGGQISLNASTIIEDSTHRFVTDTEKATWNSKASTAVVTSSANGLMSKEDKVILDNLVTQVAEIAEKIKTAIYYA